MSQASQENYHITIVSSKSDQLFQTDYPSSAFSERYWPAHKERLQETFRDLTGCRPEQMFLKRATPRGGKDYLEAFVTKTVVEIGSSAMRVSRMTNLPVVFRQHSDSGEADHHIITSHNLSGSMLAEIDGPSNETEVDRALNVGCIPEFPM